MRLIDTIKEKLLGNKFSKDSIWIFSSQIVLASSGILLNIFISNYYSAEKLGVFNQALSFFLILAAIANFGLFNTTVKYISEDLSNINRIKNIFLSSLVLGLFFSIILALLVLFILNLNISILSTEQVKHATNIILLALSPFILNRIFMGYFNGVRNMKMYSIMRILRWVLYIIFIALSSLFFNDFFISLYSFLITEILLLAIVSFKYKRLFDSKVTLSQIKKNLSFGSKSFLSEIVASLQDRLDIIVVGYILSASDVGLYSFAASIAKGILLIPAVLMQNINPIISKLWFEKKKMEIQVYIIKLRNSSLNIMLPFSFLIIVSYYLVITFLMPKEFITSMDIFLIMLIGAFLYSLVSWSGGFLLMAGKLYPNFLRVLLLLFFSVIFNLVFTYLWGIKGASFAYLVYTLFFIVLQYSFLRKSMGIYLLNSNILRRFI